MCLLSCSVQFLPANPNSVASDAYNPNPCYAPVVYTNPGTALDNLMQSEFCAAEYVSLHLIPLVL